MALPSPDAWNLQGAFESFEDLRWINESSAPQTRLPMRAVENIKSVLLPATNAVQHLPPGAKKTSNQGNPDGPGAHGTSPPSTGTARDAACVWLQNLGPDSPPPSLTKERRSAEHTPRERRGEVLGGPSLSSWIRERESEGGLITKGSSQCTIVEDGGPKFTKGPT